MDVANFEPFSNSNEDFVVSGDTTQFWKICGFHVCPIRANPFGLAQRKLELNGSKEQVSRNFFRPNHVIKSYARQFNYFYSHDLCIYNQA